MGALVAMVLAKFGSNKREGNRRWDGEGDSVVARPTKGKEKGGCECNDNLRINPVNHKKDLLR